MKIELLSYRIRKIGVMRIVELSGLSYPTMHGVIDQYERDGVVTVKPTLRGRQGGDGRHLTGEQERLVRQIICGKKIQFFSAA